ncbi:MAG: TRAP transporter small permease subunit [Rhizobiales bacterium]|nr:TRAP transporter small permease subunit [Hyphomicrobiales bacterium]
MITKSEEPAVAERSVIWARVFGWSMLSALVAYLFNVYFSNSLGWPGPAGILKGAGILSWLQIAFYIAAIAAASFYVLKNKEVSLVEDSAKITRFNAWLVRGVFWAVLFVGIVDATISFLRVEDLLASVVGEELTTQLGRPSFRGLFVHIPLVVVGFIIASFTRTLGFHWLTLLIVVAELSIVFTRFIFSYEQAFMGDLVRYWYGGLFLFASAYTLLEDGHVRVDVLYASFRKKTRGIVNSVGSMVLGISLCWTILIIGFGSRTAIIYSPLTNFEVSQSGYGMYVKYQLAAFLGIFAITMMIQFVASFLESVSDYLDASDDEVPEASLSHG